MPQKITLAVDNINRYLTEKLNTKDEYKTPFESSTGEFTYSSEQVETVAAIRKRIREEINGKWFGTRKHNNNN